MKSEKDDDYECESGDQDELGGWRVRRVTMTRERERIFVSVAQGKLYR